MAKVIIKSAKKTNFGGKDALFIETEDGKGGSSYWMDLENKVGQEVEVDLKEGKEYQGKMQYYFNEPKSGKGGFAKRDYTLEKKMCALNAASRMQGVKSADILKIADSYLAYLNK